MKRIHPAIGRAQRRWRRRKRALRKEYVRKVRAAAFEQMRKTPVPADTSRLPMRARRGHGDSLVYVRPLLPDGTWNPEWWAAPFEIAMLVGQARQQMQPEPAEGSFVPGFSR